jgi:predicted acylesterase/phospholipase RssA
MSMSIPFAWQEVRWRQEWDPYNFVDLSEATGDVEPRNLAGHTVVDGGALSNFPINLLTSDEAQVQAVMGDTDPHSAPTIGFLIDESLQVENAPPPPADDGDETGIVDDIKRLRTVSRISRLMNTMMAAHDSQLIRTFDELICRLPAKTYGTMEFDMTEARRAALVEAGRAAMLAHLDGRDDLTGVV